MPSPVNAVFGGLDTSACFNSVEKNFNDPEFVKRVRNQFGPFLPDRGEKPRSRMQPRMKNPKSCGASWRGVRVEQQGPP